MEKPRHRKLIDLPNSTIKQLKDLADSANNSLKAYMEWVLIQHAKGNSPKK